MGAIKFKSNTKKMLLIIGFINKVCLIVLRMKNAVANTDVNHLNHQNLQINKTN